GTYTLTIYTNGGSGPYSFNLFNAVAPITANYVLGTPVNSTLANPGDQAAYTFNAMAGQRLFYNALVNSSGIHVQLKDPFGNQIFNNNANGHNCPSLRPPARASSPLPYDTNSASGPFSFNLLTPLAPITANYVLGTPVNSTLANPGDEA